VIKKYNICENQENMDLVSYSSVLNKERFVYLRRLVKTLFSVKDTFMIKEGIFWQKSESVLKKYIKPSLDLPDFLIEKFPELTESGEELYEFGLLKMENRPFFDHFLIMQRIDYKDITKVYVYSIADKDLKDSIKEEGDFNIQNLIILKIPTFDELIADFMNNTCKYYNFTERNGLYKTSDFNDRFKDYNDLVYSINNILFCNNITELEEIDNVLKKGCNFKKRLFLVITGIGDLFFKIGDGIYREFCNKEKYGVFWKICRISIPFYMIYNWFCWLAGKFIKRNIKKK